MTTKTKAKSRKIELPIGKVVIAVGTDASGNKAWAKADTVKAASASFAAVARRGKITAYYAVHKDTTVNGMGEFASPMGADKPFKIGEPNPRRRQRDENKPDKHPQIAA